MESTRNVPARKSYKTALSASELNFLILNLHEIKELVYFSICKPAVFSSWAQTHVESEERDLLSEYSKLFLERFLPGFVIAEEMLVQQQKDIYVERQELSQLRQELTAFLNDPHSLQETAVGFKKEITYLCVTLEQLFADRDNYLKNAELALSAEYLDGLWQYQIEIIKLYTSIHDAIENYVAEGNKVSEPFLKLLRDSKAKFISLSVNQRQVEKSVTEKRKAQEFQASVMVLMLENRIDKLSRFLTKFPNIAVFLNANVNLLRPLQYKFQQFLLGNPDLIPKMISKAENQEMISHRAEAAKKYQEKLAQEINKNKAALFEQEKILQQNHESATQYYSENKLTEALSLYLKGAKDFHPDHLYSAGEMILKGVACQPHALMACDFFRAVTILAANEAQKIAAQEKLKIAYRKALAEPGLVWDKDATEIHREIHHAHLSLQDIDKKIKAISNGDLAKKYFNAADSYLAQYKIELVYSNTRFEEPSPCLREVCRYFREAYEFVNRLYQNSKIVHENFLLYAKRNGVDLDQIDEINLEASDEEVKAICYRFKEVEKNVQEAKKQRIDMIDKIARKIAPVYYFIENKKDLGLFDQLCDKVGIDVGVMQVIPQPKRRNSK